MKMILDFLINILAVVGTIISILLAYSGFYGGKINEAIFWIICGVLCELMQIKLKIDS